MVWFEMVMVLDEGMVGQPTCEKRHYFIHHIFTNSRNVLVSETLTLERPIVYFTCKLVHNYVQNVGCERSKVKACIQF